MKFEYCPNCKGKLNKEKNRYLCQNCGMEIFRDSAPTASALIIKDGKVLLSTRAIQPKKGMYDVVGGFLENGEHPDKGVKREVKEETGLDIKIVDRLGVYVDEYEHQGRKTKTLNFYYVARIVDGKMKPDDDVETLEWFPAEKLPIDKIAFDSQKELLKDFKRWYDKNRA